MDAFAVRGQLLLGSDDPQIAPCLREREAGGLDLLGGFPPGPASSKVFTPAELGPGPLEGARLQKLPAEGLREGFVRLDIRRQQRTAPAGERHPERPARRAGVVLERV